MLESKGLQSQTSSLIESVPDKRESILAINLSANEPFRPELGNILTLESHLKTLLTFIMSFES